MDHTKEDYKIYKCDNCGQTTYSPKRDMTVAPSYCEENYKFKQGGNLWHNYGNALYKTSNEEIDKRIQECIEKLNEDATLNFVENSNGDTLIIATRDKFGHYNIYVSKGYQSCCVAPSSPRFKEENNEMESKY